LAARGASLLGSLGASSSSDSAPVAPSAPDAPAAADADSPAWIPGDYVLDAIGQIQDFLNSYGLRARLRELFPSYDTDTLISYANAETSLALSSFSAGPAALIAILAVALALASAITSLVASAFNTTAAGARVILTLQALGGPESLKVNKAILSERKACINRILKERGANAKNLKMGEVLMAKADLNAAAATAASGLGSGGLIGELAGKGGKNLSAFASATTAQTPQLS